MWGFPVNSKLTEIHIFLMSTLVPKMRNYVDFRQPAIPMIITCLLQGILCDKGIPRTFYGGKFVVYKYKSVNQFWWNLPYQNGKKFSRWNVEIFSHLQMDIFCHFDVCHSTGTPPLMRFFGPGKNRVKGKPRYRRSNLVLKPKNGEYVRSKSTFWAKCTLQTKVIKVVTVMNAIWKLGLRLLVAFPTLYNYNLLTKLEVWRKKICWKKFFDQKKIFFPIF